MSDSTTPSGVSRRDFLKAGVTAGAVAGGGLGGFALGYGKALGSPVRVGVIGTGDEGCVLMGFLNPDFHPGPLDLRHPPVQPLPRLPRRDGRAHPPGAALGLPATAGRPKSEARRHVKVYEGSYDELIRNAKHDGVEAVIIALPLHLHAPAAIAAMQAGLHVITEKLMGHSVAECKEMARIARQTKLHLATGHQRHYNVLYAQADGPHPARAVWASCTTSAPSGIAAICRARTVGSSRCRRASRTEKASEELAKKLKDAKAKAGGGLGPGAVGWAAAGRAVGGPDRRRDAAHDQGPRRAA